jgi:hypothetical protein
MGKYIQWYNTKEWKKIRFRHLHYYPWCVVCASVGRHTKANVVDHVVRHNGNWDKFIAGPFQSLCKQCHDSYKQRLDHGGKPNPLRTIGIDGLPTDGSWG